MRRTDLPGASFPHGRPPSRRPMPDSVYREFVDDLFKMALPVFGMGVAYVGVALMAADFLHDSVIKVLAFLAGGLTAVRLTTIGAYRLKRRRDGAVPLRMWERRYAYGSYALAILLAALNIRALSYHQPALHLVCVSLVFGYGAGVVARTSIRPRICVTSILLATVPTILALAAHARTSAVATAHLQLFAVEAILVAVITALSIQTAFHMYRTATRHLITEHDMTHLAKRDALTGLANRLQLREAFENQRAGLSAPGSGPAILCLDLDGFKPVNDAHGHPTGDALLREVARRLEASVRASDLVARLGGDEFVVLQVSVTQASEAELLGRRIIRALSKPYDLDGSMVRISASVGIALSYGDDIDLDQLLTSADTALYRAKADGKGLARLAARHQNGARHRLAA